ncbi:hypothetical protein HZB96_03970 [Candidatus Gottesmanbacteria bacterium]|nr:hypothetical protein [Candidatus Gottesmanbacteria bacterium]
MIIKRITISFQKLISFPLVRVIFAVLLSFAFLVVAFPPLNIWPLVFIAFFSWFKILSTRGFSEKNIFWGGILFGFLYYVFFFHVYLISAPYPWLGISPYIVWGVVIAILVFMGLLHGLAWGLYSLVSKRLIFASRMSTFLIVTILSSFWIFIELILFYLNFDMGVSLGYFLPVGGFGVG